VTIARHYCLDVKAIGKNPYRLRKNRNSRDSLLWHGESGGIRFTDKARHSMHPDLVVKAISQIVIAILFVILLVLLLVALKKG
jgi:hypothetical protein